MGILDWGCTCPTCLERTKQTLQIARDRWKNGERYIVFEPYHYTCSDGCCDDYGTKVFVNGFDINCNGDDAVSVLAGIMEFLEVDNVEIDYDYDDDL